MGSTVSMPFVPLISHFARQIIRERRLSRFLALRHLATLRFFAFASAWVAEIPYERRRREPECAGGWQGRPSTLCDIAPKS